MTDINPDVAKVAEEYYDSQDADNFYFRVWGGEDIHIGIYQSDEEPISKASARTVETMMNMIAHRAKGARILDIGAGYGGSARALAKSMGAHVTCLNLSEVQNERNRNFNKEQGLDSLIDVVHGNFEELPFDADQFDVVWSQDAILHSGMRSRVFLEVDRVLKAGGEFVFSDPMQTDTADKIKLKPVLDRIHLDSLASVSVYKKYAENRGWKLLEYHDFADHLRFHYSSVLNNLKAREAELLSFCSQAYLDKMKAGLQHWIDASNSQLLTWGLFHFRKV